MHSKSNRVTHVGFLAYSMGRSSGILPVLLCLMLESLGMRCAGYNMLGGVECASCASCAVQVEGVSAALHSAPDGGSPFEAVCTPALSSITADD